MQDKVKNIAADVDFGRPLGLNPKDAGIQILSYLESTFQQGHDFEAVAAQRLVEKEISNVREVCLQRGLSSKDTQTALDHVRFVNSGFWTNAIKPWTGSSLDGILQTPAFDTDNTIVKECSATEFKSTSKQTTDTISRGFMNESELYTSVEKSGELKSYFFIPTKNTETGDITWIVNKKHKHWKQCQCTCKPFIVTTVYPFHDFLCIN